MLETFKQYFHKILHPEILTRKFDINNEKDRKVYCFCRRTSFEILIACDCTHVHTNGFITGAYMLLGHQKVDGFAVTVQRNKQKK